MNKKTATKAQIRRVVETLEAMGKTVTGIAARPDGSVHVLLTEAHAPAPDPDSGDPWEAYDRSHGYG